MKTADDKTRLRVAIAVVTQIDPALTKPEIVDKAVRGDFPQPKGNSSLVAYVNHDRWVADCPCGGAELVSPGEPMLCGSCGVTFNVTFPKDKARIEETLSLRQSPLTRNWYPDESVDELVAQNLEHGILEVV